MLRDPGSPEGAAEKHMTANEVIKKTVLARINGDKKHGWGVDDCAATIAALIENANGKAPSAELMAAITTQINPSQARQSFEKAGLLTKTPEGQRKPAMLAALFAK